MPLRLLHQATLRSHLRIQPSPANLPHHPFLLPDPPCSLPCFHPLPLQLGRRSVLRLHGRSALAGAALLGGVAMGGAVMSLPWEDEVVYGMERDTTPLEHEADISHELFQRTTVYFDSKGVRWGSGGGRRLPCVRLCVGQGVRGARCLDVVWVAGCGHGMQ